MEQTPPVQQIQQTVAPQPKKQSGVLSSVLLLILGILIGLLLSKTTIFSSLRIPYLSATPTPTLIPTPTPDPTADWKTYTNTKYGYTVKYPPEWSLEKGPMEGQPDAVFQTHNYVSFGSASMLGSPNTGMGFSITINPSDRNGVKIECSTVELCINRFVAELGNPKTDPIEIVIQDQNLKGFTFNANNPLYTQNFQYYLTIFGDNVFEFSFTANNYGYVEAKSLFDQILSTFRFTEQTTETSNWKTYTVESGAYTFKYPGNTVPIEINTNNPYFYNTQTEAVTAKDCIINQKGTATNPCSSGLFSVYAVRSLDTLKGSASTPTYNYTDAYGRNWFIVAPVFGLGGTETRAEGTFDHVYQIEIHINSNFMKGETDSDIEKQKEFIQKILSSFTVAK